MLQLFLRKSETFLVMWTGITGKLVIPEIQIYF